MGTAALSTLRRLGRGTVTAFTMPDPRTIRRYGILIMLVLGVPKVLWDVVRLRQSAQKLDETDEFGQEPVKDPTLRVLRIAVQKAAEELRDMWEQCISPYCAGASRIGPRVLGVFDEATALCAKLAAEDDKDEDADDDDDDDDDEENEAENKNDGEDPDEDEGKHDDGVAEDSFLEQWDSTLHQAIIRPLIKAFRSKPDDADKEKDIRELAAAVYYVADVFEAMIVMQRRVNATLKFADTQDALKKSQAELCRATAAAAQAEAAAAAAAVIPAADAAADADADADADSAVDVAQAKCTKLNDANNRARTKLHQMCEKGGRRRIHVEGYSWTISPDALRDALRDEVAQLGLASAAELVTADHVKYWKEPEHNDGRCDLYEELFPKAHGDVLYPMYLSVAADARRAEIRADKLLGSVKKARFAKLFQFVHHDLCGKWSQRSLVVLAWILGAVDKIIETTESHFRTNLLLRSVEHVAQVTTSTLRAGAQAGARAGLAAVKNPKLLDVCISIVVLKFTSVLLKDLFKKVKDAGQGSIRKTLAKRVAHHVLSQDLEDAGRAPGQRRRGRDQPEPSDIIRSLSDQREWDYSLGSVLLIPQDLVSQVTGVVSAGLLLWNKSPRLLVAMIAVIQSNKWLARQLDRFQRYCTKKAGLDKQTWDGWVAQRSVEQALDDFEDMRVNAKEFAILKDVEKTQAKKELEEINHRLMPSLFEPFDSFLADLPTIAGAYLGGLLTQSGGISSSDLAGFTYQIACLTGDFKNLKTTLEGLWKLEDKRFQHGFAIIDMLEQQPKIGIDGGWQPATSARAAAAAAPGGNNNAATAAAAQGDEEANEPGDGEANKLGGEIRFENVSFKYKGMQKSMLKGASFTIPGGSFVGICGERGAGKSTMFKLLMRLYDVAKGRILIGGKPIKYYNPVWLRSQIGISKQDPVIFNHKTLRENVMYGSEDAMRKLGGPIEADKHIEKVLRKANVWEHFCNKEKFPQGLATHCWHLSGGETRSVGTARALLKDPAILLLDEPTEGLDAENEARVMHNLIAKRPKGQTVLAIAHRLSSIKEADMIVFLGKDGRIAEIGTWDELVNIPNGRFAAFEGVQNLNRDGHSSGSVSASSGVASGTTVGGGSSVASGPSGAAEGTGSKTNNTSSSGDDSTSTVSSDDELYQQRRLELMERDGPNPIGEAIDAVRQLRKLASAAEVPYELYVNLNKACDEVLDFQRVHELAATGATSWKPYGNGNEKLEHTGAQAGQKFTSPAAMVKSLRTASIGMRSPSSKVGRNSGGGGGGGGGSRRANTRGRRMSKNSRSMASLSPVRVNRSTHNTSAGGLRVSTVF